MAIPLKTFSSLWWSLPLGLTPAKVALITPASSITICSTDYSLPRNHILVIDRRISLLSLSIRQNHSLYQSAEPWRTCDYSTFPLPFMIDSLRARSGGYYSV